MELELTTKYPNPEQVYAVATRSQADMQTQAYTYPPQIAQLLGLFHRIPDVGVEADVNDRWRLRIYTTEASNIHLIAIHLAVMERYTAMWPNYDWLTPGGCHLTMEYFLSRTTPNSATWFPTWVINYHVLENPNFATTYQRIWLDVLPNYLRSIGRY